MKTAGASGYDKSWAWGWRAGREHPLDIPPTQTKAKQTKRQSPSSQPDDKDKDERDTPGPASPPCAHPSQPPPEPRSCVSALRTPRSRSSTAAAPARTGRAAPGAAASPCLPLSLEPAPSPLLSLTLTLFRCLEGIGSGVSSFGLARIWICARKAPRTVLITTSREARRFKRIGARGWP